MKIYLGEEGARFSVLSNSALSGNITMKFKRPKSLDTIEIIAAISNVDVVYKGITYPKEQVAYFNRQPTHFTETGGWLVQIIQSRTNPIQILKSDYIYFNVEE